jgi:flagellar hook-associated protein 3 FlgL
MYNLELLNERNSKVTYGLSSNKALEQGSDDPEKYDYLLSIQNNLNTYTSIENRIELSSSYNTFSDTTTSGIKTAMESINTNIIEALNDTTNSEDKFIIANEIEQIKDTLFSLVNDSTNGEYLFSGNNTDTVPFVKDEVTGQISYESDYSNKTVNVEKNQYAVQGINGIDLIYYTNASASSGETLDFTANDIILDDNGNEWKILDNDNDGIYDGLYLNGDNTTTPISLTTNSDGTFSITNTENIELESKHSYFDDLDELIAALKQEDTNGNTITSSEASTLLSGALDKFDLAYDNTNSSHAKLGIRTNLIETYAQSIQSKLTNFTLLEEQYGSADLTALAIESQSLENTYTALYSTINKINDLSLVKYIS